jgi:hypothetical protein
MRCMMCGAEMTLIPRCLPFRRYVRARGARRAPMPAELRTEPAEQRGGLDNRADRQSRSTSSSFSRFESYQAAWLSL